MIKPTEFAPGKKFGTGTMAPVDYLVALAEGRVPPPSNLNIQTVQHQSGLECVPVPLRAVRERGAPRTGRSAASPRRSWTSRS